jgi:hypothetical protein
MKDPDSTADLRYTVRKHHMTALQRRLYPEAARRPWVIWDSDLGRPVGLPDRYLSRSGAQARADRLNQKQEKRP